MRSGHRPNPALMAAALMALSSSAFLGAPRSPRPGDVERPLAFDPLAILRRPPRKGRKPAGAGAHCGHKQAAKYAKQGAGINVHFERRMRWNETVYPRVIEHQDEQRRRSKGKW